MESVAVVIAMEDMSAVRKERISLHFSLSPSLSRSLSISLCSLSFFPFVRVVGVVKKRRESLCM